MKDKITKNILLAAILSAGATLTSQAQVTIFSENFDPISAAGNVSVNGDVFGDTTSFSGTVVSGVGVGGTAAIEEVLNAASGSAGYSGANVLYGNGSLAGNASSSLSDYTLSFDAEANGGSLRLNLQSWQLNGYVNYQGQMSTAPDNPGYGNDLTLTSTYTHYSLNLGNTSIFQSTTDGFQPNGGTMLITFQLDGSGPTPYTDTLNVDNLMLTMAAPVPEPSSLALCAVGGLGAFGFLSRRKINS
jgi:PEP-CTERM motif